MNITINGKEETIDAENLTVIELLGKQNVEMPDMVSVELNGVILKRNTFEEINVSDGDTVEFLYFMGGGGR